MKSKIIKSLLVIFLFVGIQIIFTNNSYATESCVRNFYDFQRSGNVAEDIVRCAEAQAGRSQANIGYHEDWCADFVSDCAIKVGIQDIIPADGLVTNLYNNVINSGGQRVGSPQRGDLVFYWCYSDNGWMHVGIMQNSSQSIDGNYYYNGDSTSRCIQNISWTYYDSGGHTCEKVYVRPNYASKDKPQLPQAPTVTGYKVLMNSITGSSYQIVANVSAPGGVKYVAFPTWTIEKGNANGNTQDDIQNPWPNGTRQNDGSYIFTIRKSEHNNENGIYHTDIYVCDNYDQKGSLRGPEVCMGSTIQNLGNFTTRIAYRGDSNRVLGVTETSSGSQVKIMNQNISDNKQIWKFTRQSDGSYSIQNVGTGLYMDVNGGVGDNGTKIQIYGENNSAAQDFYIMNYNGGYRIVCKASPDLKAIDVYGNDYTNNNSLIDEYEICSSSNAAQTWTLQKIATGLSISSSLTIKDGESASIAGTITPSDTAIKKLSYSTSNPNVATVSSDGYIKGISIGNCIITVKTTDGSNLSKTCYITVIKNVKLNYTSYQLRNVGDTIKLISNTTGEKWVSSSPSVASVSSDGTVTALRGGCSTITVSSSEGSCSCLIYCSIPIKLKNGITTTVGDLDGNGVLDSNDASMILDLFKNGVNGDIDLYYAADLNGDGFIDTKDAGMVLDSFKEGNIFNDMNSSKVFKFKDVSSSDWFYMAVKDIYNKGIVAGYNSTTFAPADTVTRAQMVTFIWRMAGSPNVSNGQVFSDVPTSSVYANPIKWACENGIVHGYGNGNYGPDDKVTRDQIAIMLMNYCQYRGQYQNTDSNLTSFGDYREIPNWAEAAMKWAVRKWSHNWK